jgi:hypothetical protein
MKRRKFFASAVAVPILAQQGPPGQPAELPKLEIGTADDVASMQPKYFSASQFAALSRLAEILVPTPEAGVGAKEAKAAEFLDFLIGQSPADRQQVYLKGLDALIAQAKQKHQSSFEALSEAQANSLLEPLRKPWTYEPSPDPLTRFLQTAKADVRTATQNSKEFNLKSGGGSRRPGGVGMYWYPLG